MTLSIVQLGSVRGRDEGPRIGTVRKPPRGVPKAEFSSRNFYDVWLPELSPSVGLMTLAKAAQSAAEWARFTRRFKAELNRPDANHILDLMAALSHQSHFAIGCCCDEESHCHRSVLRELLQARGALLR